MVGWVMDTEFQLQIGVGVTRDPIRGGFKHRSLLRSSVGTVANL